MKKLHANARKKAHIRYDSSDDSADDSVDDSADDLVDDSADDFVDDFVDNFVDDFVDDLIDDFADDFVDDFADDFADDFVDDLVHFVHFVDEDNVFSTFSEASFIRKVFISIRKKVSTKKKISSSSSSKIIIYLLNVKMMYEKNVIFQIFISRQVNSESIAYDEKAFHFISHKMNMKKKARRFANAKIFACHLINVKTTMM
jgi:hypothetical protein